MKNCKNLLLTLLAMSLLASCNKEGLYSESREVVGIAPVVENNKTKAVITGTAFPTSRSMVVSADLNADTGGSGNYFSNETFTYGTSDWVPAHTYYWPLAGTLEMLAYSAGSASVTPTWTNATKLVLSCANCSADDILVGGLTGAKSSSKTIVFKHALSQIKCTASANVGSTIKVKSITFNAKKGATLTVTKSAGSSNVSVATALTGSATENAVLSGGNVTVGTSAAAIGSPILIPAQTPSSMTITYTMMNGGAESPVMTVNKELSTSMTPGNAYTFAIAFSVTGITVTATLTDWDSSSSQEIKIPEPIYSFGGYMVAPGYLYYDGTEFKIADEWTFNSKNSIYGLNAGSTYFNLAQVASYFSSTGSYNYLTGLDNANTISYGGYDDWRVASTSEYMMIVQQGVGTLPSRSGSTVNGVAGKKNAKITGDYKGILVFPDDEVINGATLTYNKMIGDSLTLEEIQEYVSQGCAFFPMNGSYANGAWSTAVYSSEHLVSNACTYIGSKYYYDTYTISVGGEETYSYPWSNSVLSSPYTSFRLIRDIN